MGKKNGRKSGSGTSDTRHPEHIYVPEKKNIPDSYQYGLLYPLAKNNQKNQDFGEKIRQRSITMTPQPRKSEMASAGSLASPADRHSAALLNYAWTGKSYRYLVLPKPASEKNTLRSNENPWSFPSRIK